MTTAPTTQLKTDLALILNAIKNDPEVSPPIKRHFGEFAAWCEAHVDHSKDLDDRLESSEAALTEIIEGDGEMVTPETAQTVITANEHGQLLCQATAALLEGPLGASIDAVSKKRFQQLIENTLRACALSTQTIREIAANYESDEGDDDGLGDDGDGDGDGLGDDGDSKAEAGETEEDARGG